jgi:anti-sigma factor RsiW
VLKNVAMDDPNVHLTPERIQVYLDGGLLDEEVADVRQHATFCELCQAELEAWQLLYAELGGLQELSPSTEMRSSVMAEVRARLEEHLVAGRIQDFLEGVLAAPAAASVRAHLENCGECRAEVAGWRRVLDGLGSLERLEPSPALAARVMETWRAEAVEQLVSEAEVDRLLAGLGHLEPSPAFARRVMAQVRIGELVRQQAEPQPIAVLARKAAVWAGRIVPRTRKTWAAVSGVAVTPVSVVALVAYTVFSNPLVTPTNLVSFVWWKVGGIASAIGTALVDGAVESATLFQLYSALEYLIASPAVAALGAVSFAMLTCGALWVVYKNLLTAPAVEPRYASVRV